MSAFWQALDLCAGQNLWTPTFLELYGGRGGWAATLHALPLHLASLWPFCCLSLAGLAGWLPGWLAASLAGGWLVGCLAGCLVGWRLPGWLFA